MEPENSKDTKTNIILALLELGEEKGFSNTSLADLAQVVGIKKASIYSHFESFKDLTDSTIKYCQNLLASKNFIVDFKAKNAEDLLSSLVDSFLMTFAEKPLCSYFAIICQQRLFNQDFEDLYNNLVNMITARIRVALEYCIQRSWLDIKDSDIASDYFASALIDCLCTVIMNNKNKPSRNNTDWELERLVQGMLSLFG
ncbi:MAG: TetR/AcrR family transcriptional regulator [Sphaerochaetaceae bacterium]|nr:TetR/AcrR family transcriptional regulator [Sphaerochaetaceae bacterium]